MSFPLHTLARGAAAVVMFVGILGAGAASAQPADHLECYRGHDDLRLNGSVDIDSVQFGLSPDCKIKRSRFFCAPAKATVVQSNVAPLLTVAGGPMPGDSVCYQVRCPNTDNPAQTVTDQFGTRVFKLNRRSFLLCTPAVKGTQYCGDGVKNGSETCDGGDAAACPGACGTDCTCPATTCGNGTQEIGEQCDGTDFDPALTCGAECLADCRCRFVDNGNGTVTDNQSRLQWEKKDNDCPGIHCVSTYYQWSAPAPAPNGNAFTSFLATLNGGATGVGDCTTSDGVTQVGGFAGHCDWRLPTVMELKTIRSLACTTTPCHDPILGPAVQPGSTASTWSSTTDATFPTAAWTFDLNYGYPGTASKGAALWVRAVRGGS